MGGSGVRNGGVYWHRRTPEASKAAVIGEQRLISSEGGPNGPVLGA